MKLIPVEGNPFATPNGMTAVEGNPFEPGGQETGTDETAKVSPKEIAGNIGMGEDFGFPSGLFRSREVLEKTNQLRRNVPESAGVYGKGLVSAIASPIETARAIGGIVQGGLQKAFVPGEQPEEESFSQFIDIFKKRYATPEDIERSLIEDPVGSAADISTLLFGGGAALRGLGAATKSQGITAAGKAVAKGGAIVDPVGATTAAGTKAVKALSPPGVPEKMYASAAKFSTTIPESERAAMVATALENKIMPTSGGVDKARRLIDGLNDEITGIIDNATQTGQKIDVNSLFTYLDDVRKDAILTGVPVQNLRAIDRIENQITAINNRLGRTDLTPSEVQRLKQNIYKDVTFASPKEKVRYSEEAQKAVARAAKEQIEAIHPEIKGMNAKEGALINLLKSIERSASRIGNRDILGIGIPLKGGLGAALGDGPGAAAGIATGLLDTPSVKAALAIALKQAGKKKPSIAGGAVRSTAFQGDRASNPPPLGFALDPQR